MVREGKRGVKGGDKRGRNNICHKVFHRAGHATTLPRLCDHVFRSQNCCLLRLCIFAVAELILTLLP